MVEDIIFSKEPIRKSLTEWIVLYKDQLSEKVVFTIYDDNKAGQAVVCSDGLDNELFFFLVNYLAYGCTEPNCKNVYGYTIGRGTPVIDGRQIVVYIPEGEKEYDNVTVAVSPTEAYTIDFNWKISPGKMYGGNIPNHINLSNLSVIDTVCVKDVNGSHQVADRAKSTSETKSLWSVLFNIIGAILFVIAIQTKWRIFLPLLLFAYLACDYKRLQKLDSYLKLLLITTACTVMFVWARLYYNDNDLDFSLFMPISLLLVQRLENPLKLVPFIHSNLTPVKFFHSSILIILVFFLFFLSVIPGSTLNFVYKYNDSFLLLHLRSDSPKSSMRIA